MFSRTWVLILIIAAAGPTASQGKKETPSTRPKAGPEHEVLKELVGTWFVTWKMPMLPGDLEYSGTQENELDVNGRWLIEKCELPDLTGQPYSMRAITGYDPDSKKYVTTSVDSLRPGADAYEGEWNKGEKTLTWHERTDSKKGGETKVLHIIDKKNYTVMIFPTSSTRDQDATFRIEYKRKK